MGVSINTANRPIPNADDYSVVPPGYKRTEVGLIPVDWDVKTLNELGTFMKGKGIKAMMSPNDGCLHPLRRNLHPLRDYVYSFASRIPESVAQTAQPLAGDLLSQGLARRRKRSASVWRILARKRPTQEAILSILRPRRARTRFTLATFSIMPSSRSKRHVMAGAMPLSTSAPETWQ